MKIGYFLSCEEYDPRELVRQARLAEEAGFSGLWISDHFHPWNDAQGQSAFVWTVIGALAEATNLPVATAVTCPTIRTHPAIIAQAAATAQVMLEGRFSLGVGSGEALNEHILGDRWPAAQERLDMLAEAVEIMRELWTGRVVTMSTDHYDVEHARIYTLPDAPPPVLVSGFGPKAVDLAARIGDGFVTVMPDEDAISRFRSAAGGDKIVQAGTKVCFGPDEAQAVKTVHRIWPNEGLPGERHIAAVQEYADAGADELYIQQIGDDQEAFFEAYSRDVLPKFA
jgi:G6PDH family F420-dependent oxidoreductase